MTRGINSDLILKAVSGDRLAIQKMEIIYLPYINELSTKLLFDEEGNEFHGINVDYQDALHTKLLDLISKFKIA